ncbi:MAG TPA: AAA family ATPase [Lacibacter sp.]|nr:AAA family ATPase [Lacibacter sp.]HMO89968.1 AAA family ATPase [Lacibacter sp.]
MESLLEISLSRIERAPVSFTRYLYANIDWRDRLIGILGARGTGKTTLLLQYGRLQLKNAKTLYLSLDGLFFQQHTLSAVADYFYKRGYRHLLLDEVHKYPQWSLEVKNLYDQYPDLQLIFTGSSVVELFQGQADISRRAVFYTLHGLSFREFLALDSGLELPAYPLQQLLEQHVPVSRSLLSQLASPLAHFARYLSVGCYPYYRENETNYHHRLRNTVNQVLETDIPAVANLSYASVLKLKSLLQVLAESVPFKPNISWISGQVGVKRETVLHYLTLLERAGILRLLPAAAAGVAGMNKPEKIYLDNTNLVAALGGGRADKGNLRETFFYNQVGALHRVGYSGVADFEVDQQYLFEVGGKGKSRRQLAQHPAGYIVADDLETGLGQKVPLWLFGFLY